MSEPLTASDYSYLDRQTFTYQSVKQLIAEHRTSDASDRHVKGRPGIPGTIGVLNERVQTLVSLGLCESAARLIERKVRKAYRMPK